MKLITTLAGVLAVLFLLAGGPLYKAEVLGLMQAFMGMRIALILGGVTIVLALIQIIFMRKNISWPATGFALLLAVFAISMPVSMMMKGKSVPAIHDITTDLVNPPEFVSILALRADAPNPPEYLGEEIAKQQRMAYPELQTKTYQQSSDKVFVAALTAVKAMGLEIVATEPTQGRIEAVETSAWFGFKDDVVLRIQTQGQNTLVDARSKSRIGRSDLGKNAERINSILAGLESNL